MKKYIMLVSIVSLIVLVAACQPQIKVTEELVKQTFEQHEQILTFYADRFAKQDLVQEAVLTNSRFGTRYYTIKTQAGAERPRSETTFKVPAKFFEDDEDFWENDPGRIVSTKKTGEVTLRELFQVQKMIALDFHLWRLFLRNNKFLSIGPSQSGENVQIHFNKTAGYIYCPQTGQKPTVAQGTKLVQLSPYWFYFIEE